MNIGLTVLMLCKRNKNPAHAFRILVAQGLQSLSDKSDFLSTFIPIASTFCAKICPSNPFFLDALKTFSVDTDFQESPY
jgi:hypothetical protein